MSSDTQEGQLAEEQSHAGTRSELLLLASAAAWGLGIALSLTHLFVRPARPGQAVGYLASHGVDATAVFQFILVLIPLPIVAAMVGRWMFGRWFEGTFSPDPVRLASICFAAGLWMGALGAGTASVIVLPLTGVAVALLTRTRSPGWSAEDLILLPAFLGLFFSLHDLLTWFEIGENAALAALLVMILRIGVARLLPSPALAPRAFVLAPLAIVVQSSFVEPSFRSAGWPGLLLTIGTPLLLAVAIRIRPGITSIARIIAVCVVFPLVVFAYPSTRGIGYAESLPRVHMFENGHSLMPASEMLRGELPWKDIVPGHGLVTDGLLDLVAMNISDDRIGRVLHWRWRFASLNSIIIYLLVLAATRSPEAGLGAFFLGYTLWGAPFGRAVVSLLTVTAAIVAGVRSRLRWFAVSGFLLVLAGLHSLDFCVYAVAAVAVAILLYGTTWRERARALGFTTAGVALAAIPMAAVMLWLGILDDFLRVTFVEVLSLGPVYSLGFPDPSVIAPQPWTLPDVLVHLVRRASFPYLAWLSTLIVVACLAAVRRRPRSLDPAIVIGAWILIASLSWFERHHLYFMVAMSAFIVVLATALWRRGGFASRSAAGWIIAVSIAVAQPTAHLIGVANVRRMPLGISAGWSEYREVPRARGALFRETDVRNLEVVRGLIDEHLEDHETFFDFANAPILHFLFDRPVPIRQYEVAFYQTEALQREVIARLENNPDVRMAIFRFATELGHTIDGIPNEERAPLVAEYLLANFEVVLATEDVVVALRKEER